MARAHPPKRRPPLREACYFPYCPRVPDSLLCLQHPLRVSCQFFSYTYQ